jgi:hypothetical protein
VAHKALLIANWEYRDPAEVLTPLKGPRNDLEAMKRALTDSTFGLFDEANLTAYSNVTYAQLPRIFYQFLSTAGRDDSLLLYFSGHGERLLSSDERLALCSIDTDHTSLEPTSFDTAQLRGWIDYFNRAPSTIIVFDCCYAGQMKGALNEQSVISSLGVGTMVLASGRNKPAPDAGSESEPSPFTGALTKILVDPEVRGDTDGWLTADAVYDQLTALVPPLLPPPYRNVQSQGTFALARRQPPITLTRQELKGYQAPDSVEVIELTFGTESVSMLWENGNTETRRLTALDDHRQMAVRRLGQLADAVLRIPECTDDAWYQLAVQKAWNTIGINLFETAIPRAAQRRLRTGIDGGGRRLLKLQLKFEGAAIPLEAYAWEYLPFGRVPGVEPPGSDELLPLALRPGLLIERVAPAGGVLVSPPPEGTIATAGVVNCLPEKFASAAARVADDLKMLPKLNLIIDLKAGTARWSSFLDAFRSQQPQILLLFALLRRGPRGVQVGFAPDNSGEHEWHLASEFINALQQAELSFDAIVFVTFAAKPGRDSSRGTIEFAGALARSGIGPVAFVCHAPGYDVNAGDRERDAFPVLLVNALTWGKELDQAFYYAKNRVYWQGSEKTRPTFGAPGYYVIARDEPRPARPAFPRKGGRLSAEGGDTSAAREGNAGP